MVAQRCGHAVSRHSPAAMRPSPKYTWLVFFMFLPSVFSTFTPANMPTPIMAETMPKIRVVECSESRT